MRGATRASSPSAEVLHYFNPRSSCEERHEFDMAFAKLEISIHAPHARNDQRLLTQSQVARKFQSTLLMRGATGESPTTCSVAIRFQSTLLMRGATIPSSSSGRAIEHFNPRSSCEERPLLFSRLSSAVSFQSTLLMRGATFAPKLIIRRALNFNPRSSCEERPMAMHSASTCKNFNPRSSCEERLVGKLEDGLIP